MPWTFAHPAAILPLRRLCPRWLSFPALILGAMAPDISYYVGLHGKGREFCHTPEGIVLVCLPVSLLLLALMLRFARPLTVLLPEPHSALVRAQLQPSPHRAWVGVAVMAVSVLLGAATHVVWDSFTHQDAWGAELDEPLLEGLDPQLQLMPLQHLSTAAGVLVLAFAYWRAVRAQRLSTPPVHDPRRAQRIRLMLACLAVAAAVGAASAYALTPATLPAYVSHRLVRTVVWTTSCFATLFVIASAIWWRRVGDA